jgi:superfamily I DNA/RNA helicase/mRNA-degrading endonuclease RelE of RelBE toxin-antitoxin system
MEFRIADTFTDSLARLTGEEQKSVKTAAFDLQMNPSQPSLQLHRIDKSKDRNFWSARVSLDLRLIVHRTESSLLLCFVHHHAEAYDWARRRKLETHPKTGAAQLVELRETVQEIAVPKYIEVERPEVPKPALFANTPDNELLACGVPVEWLDEVRMADEDRLLVLAEHLPAEAAEALLDLATGAKPKALPAVLSGSDPFAHPDAQRRFRVMRNAEELERALDYPWDKWTVFLHPAQRQLVERDYSGSARVAGSAGTGKTIVALHRAASLARKHPDARILLTTFSETLASALRSRLRRLLGNEPRLGERVEVHSMNAAAARLYRANFGGVDPRLAGTSVIRETITEAATDILDHRFNSRFLLTEWNEVVDAWQLDTWESYRDVPRLGRKTRLTEARRAQLWQIFSAVRSSLAARGLVTEAGLFSRLATKLAGTARSPYDFVVVDEAQDVGIQQLRFLAALGRNRPDALFFAGDLGQRIFQQPFSWKAVGVDIRGRSTTLKINYRTSHQIRAQADRLLGASVTDVDGNTEERKGTTSVFNGPLPVIQGFDDAEAEQKAVAAWLGKRLGEDKIQPHEIGVFVRSAAELERARNAIQRDGLKAKLLDDAVEVAVGYVSVGTMHLAKGLEFRAVAVMGCDDEVIPSQERIEAAADDSDLEEVYNTERHLLYVACTRARDHLLVTGTEPVSEFLDDLAGQRATNKRRAAK